MEIRFVLLAAALVAVAGPCAMGGTTPLEQVNMRFAGAGVGRSVGVQFWVGSTRVVDSRVFAGSLNHEFGSSSAVSDGAGAYLGGRTIGTFCTDILESVDSHWRSYGVDAVTSAPENYSTLSDPMGGARAGRLGQLYNFGMSTGLLNECGGWASSSAASTNRDAASAWQLLVWEIVFGDANDANWDTQGSLRVSGLTSGVRDHFAQFRNTSAGYSGELGGFRAMTRNGSQDQLVVIPLPPAAYAGMGMLGVVMGARYLRRRRARIG